LEIQKEVEGYNSEIEKIIDQGYEDEQPAAEDEKTAILDGRYLVVKVVDGDTFDVSFNGQTERIRVIGLNTPETVDPRRPVECFGQEASKKARELLSGREVRLEADPSQPDRDKYGRLLRYAYLDNGTDFSLKMIEEGYGHEYTPELPYKNQSLYDEAEINARQKELGLWASGACAQK
jgi:micrococcal nuclease